MDDEDSPEEALPILKRARAKTTADVARRRKERMLERMRIMCDKQKGLVRFVEYFKLFYESDV